MAEEETIDEVVTRSSRDNGTLASRRGVITEHLDVDGHPVPLRGGTKDVEEEQIREGGSPARRYKDSTEALLAKLENPDAEPVDPDDVGLIEQSKTVEQVAAEKAADPAAPAVEAKPAVTAAPTEIDTLRAERDRLADHNRKLIEDDSKKPVASALDDRLKTLDDAERSYLDDNIGAIRKLMGLALGAAPDSKEVDDELAGLYTDLTSRELKVPLEQAHKATREAARARQMLARDKRERKAESADTTKRASEDQGALKDESASQHVHRAFLQAKSADGQSIADRYPMLTAFAEELDGMSPQMLLWKVLERDAKAGIIPVEPGPEGERRMLESAAKSIEDHYNAISDKFAKAKPATKTEPAKPGEPATAASKDQRQSAVPRPITNASASVAPATSPATKAALEPKPQERPKFKSTREEKDYFIRKHFTS